MKKLQPKTRRQARNDTQATAPTEAIPAPTIVWHPSISLEKLISDFSQHRDAIIVS
jgi:hypothetical protein